MTDGKALGFVEVQGYSVALAVMDKACKAADVHIHGIDANNPPEDMEASIPVMIQVKFSGTVSHVQTALAVAREEALRYLRDDQVITKCITSGSAGIASLMALGKVSVK
ncbi:BMC domain-containing protein [Paenibacillus apiarius]|uniref:BMC domain-containing protein n=1 Tax=Paenibacillus apiarius TaxID=46240 RepID=UPI001981BF1E|nr:BMC domain-containing protein [Paenibacillus apiarius]MBN3522501.1 BMC domain-containing protein [Paenibacillus apiarius]